MGPKKKARINRAAPANDNNSEQKRTQGSVEEKLSVLDWHHANGENQTATSKQFSSIAEFGTLNQSTVGRWLKIEQTLRHEFERENAKAVRTSKVKHPKLEECLSQ